MKEKDRPLLIIIGDKLREIDMNVFVKYLLNNLKKDEDYIITDVRRDNEYILCKEAGFIPIRVKADLGIRIKRSIERDGKYPDTALWEGHSETGADNFEYLEIENNGTLDELYRKIDIFMKQFDDMEERKRLFDNRYRWFTEEY